MLMSYFVLIIDQMCKCEVNFAGILYASLSIILSLICLIFLHSLTVSFIYYVISPFLSFFERGGGIFSGRG